MSRKSKGVANENSAKAWESGELGSNMKYARVPTKNVGLQVDKVLNLETISIRLEKDLIESFKLLEKNMCLVTFL